MEQKYLIRTFGCQMNEHDSERIGGLLLSVGMSPTDDVSEARVIVLNTCAIRENADNKLYGNLGHLKPLKDRQPDLKIVVAGCLAQKDQGLIQRKAPWVDVVVGTHALPHLLELIGRAETEGPQMDVREYTETFPSALPAARADDLRAWVSVAVGCDNACTFCIVPLVRGSQRSRSIGEILAEVQELTSRGVVEVTLLGQNVNTYGRDLTVPGSARRPLFARLLREVDGVDGIRRIRFTSPHPHDFTADVVDAMAECEHVCEHIHFPLQSGSDRVLRAMQRSYRRERYLEWLARIRARSPASPSRPTSSWASRGRPNGISQTRWTWSRRPASTARTCSSTRPGPGPERRPWRTRSRRKSCRSASTDSWPCRSASPSRRIARSSDGSSRSSSRARGNARARPSREPGPTGSCTWPPRSIEAPSSTRA